MKSKKTTGPITPIVDIDDQNIDALYRTVRRVENTVYLMVVDERGARDRLLSAQLELGPELGADLADPWRKMLKELSSSLRAALAVKGEVRIKDVGALLCIVHRTLAAVLQSAMREKELAERVAIAPKKRGARGGQVNTRTAGEEGALFSDASPEQHIAPRGPLTGFARIEANNPTWRPGK